MRRTACGLALAFILGGSAAADEPASLARARTLYNEADYDGAIAEASEARQIPAVADAAALVAARAHLERYRQRADVADLVAARAALRDVRSEALTPRDRVDLLVGLGQSLFLGEAFGAAAELFDAALTQRVALPLRARTLLLDWWASALDREAQSRALDHRAPVFGRIVERMQAELASDPGCAPASYWLVVATRGSGDLEQSWDAAVAGWVRAGLDPQTTESLRRDLDRFVTQALIPDLARQRQASPREGPEPAEELRGEWELVKTQWK